ncbi:3-phosphoshikimate 1-carboxyvinyltransferase [Eggerthellaceae bacterium zg-1084]|uniref:3-phosphoshikimate 1-carboxyvinyltransferase n=1 Tax=Berryella wangjianweii TaxID=2734634 RepID=UPI001552FBA2|nr:3-phosphoshikimate 1-carboxyvinyltransferase [Berryella wangjianweii]NPD31224.1 3-phosphoshikimate 1-carboxyvinyltransferase [Berryella wangjianweii]
MTSSLLPEPAEPAEPAERVVPLRLQRFLARAGVASRRGSENLMTAGRVSVNGRVVTELGSKVDPRVDEVRVDGRVVRLADGPVTIMLHKPAGVITTMREQAGRSCVAELVPTDRYPGLYPLGRLDADTTGLLLFSTDGDLGNALLHPRHHVPKRYVAVVEGMVGQGALEQLRAGVMLDDGPAMPALAEVEPDPHRACRRYGFALPSATAPTAASRRAARERERTHPWSVVSLQISEGRYHQVKRMMEAVGHPVWALHRARFGELDLSGVERGMWRELTDAEVADLRRAAGLEGAPLEGASRVSSGSPRRASAKAGDSTGRKPDARAACAAARGAQQTATAETVTPLGAPLRGSVRVPGDKSIAHRAVLLAAMAVGTSLVRGLPDGLDVRSTIDAVRALGARVDLRERPDGGFDAAVRGWGDKGPCRAAHVDCGNSGTTARLLMGALAPFPVRCALVGDPSLSARPMRRVLDPLALMGTSADPPSATHLPLAFCGTTDLRPLDVRLEVPSAQVKSALVLAALGAHGTSCLMQAVPTRDHTERLLPLFGAELACEGERVRLTGPQVLRACDVDVPGDVSSAAFLVAAALRAPGSCVRVEGVGLNPTRLGYLEALRRMGAPVRWWVADGEGGEPVGAIEARAAREPLRGVRVRSDEVPALVDEACLLALAAAEASGVTVIEGAGELRVKESDRLRASCDLARALGARVSVSGDDLRIEGTGRIAGEAPCAQPPRRARAQGDHRVALAWAVLGLTGSRPLSVEGLACHAVSYPQFLTHIERLVS